MRMRRPRYAAAFTARATRLAGVRATLVLLSVLVFAAPSASEAGRWWFGGGIGLGFGDADFFEVTGIAGYRATDRFTPGLRLTYRNRDLRIGGTKITTDDYGGSLFARYRVWRWVYAQAEYELLSYEFVSAGLSTERETFDSWLGGGGVALPLSRKLGFFVTALYNVSYDESDFRNPYSSPWIVRSGVSYSF